MERLTEKTITGYIKRIAKNGKLYVFAVKDEEITNKLGALEDILEKYEIDDLNVLDQVLENQRFLANHDYSTLPREDFDGLFNELRDKRNALEIINKKNVSVYWAKNSSCVDEYNYENYNQRPTLEKWEFELLKGVLK